MAKIAWISRPSGPNLNHRGYIESLGADIIFIDRHDDLPFFKRFITWIKSAFIFSKKDDYDILVSIDIIYPLIFAKLLGRIPRKTKLVCFHATETLYFLKTGFYSKGTEKFLFYLLKKFDYHVCVSKYLTSMLLDFDIDEQKVYTIFNGVHNTRVESLKNVTPDLASKNIVFIGNLYSGWRLWYKGIDLMLDAYAKAKIKVPELKLDIIGESENGIQNELLEKYVPLEYRNDIRFLGRVSDFASLLNNYSLYLHCARGEAFGISVIEAMMGAVPVLVSQETGAKEVVERASKDLLFSLNPDEIANKIVHYMSLSLSEKQQLSKLCRIATDNNTQANAIVRIKEVFDIISSK